MFLAALVLIPALAGAQADSGADKSAFMRFAERDYLFGDWGGLRTDLSNHGIDFEFFYGGSFPDNLSGGARRGGVYQGAFLMDMTLDSQKLVGYEGGTFNVSALWLNGDKPFSTFANGMPNYVGDLNKVNLLDFPNAFRLWELWYQQRFLNGRLAFKVGELSIDRDFVVPEIYTSLGSPALINQTWFYPTLLFDVYDIPGLPVHNNGLAATPNTAPGAVVRWDALPLIYLQAGVYGGTPDQSYHGTEFPLDSSEGALIYYEAGYRFNLQTNDTGLAGSYKVGGFYDTSFFSDVGQAVNAAFLTQAGFPTPAIANHHGNYGGYLVAEQQLFREQDNRDRAKQGLVAFFRLLGAPADRNLAELEVDGGLVYKGLIPSRDWDTLAFGASYLKISHDIADAQSSANDLAALFGAPAPFPQIADYETVFELSYKAQLTAWWTLQASLQRVLHPGGSGALPDATVFILQTTVRF